MTFVGIQKFTLLDYPQKIAATLFSPGCNFRCPYCHNGEIVSKNIDSGNISEEEVLSFLKTRVGKLTGVCFTGGEATLQNNLIEFITEVKSLGFDIKLDTNGQKPEILEELYKRQLLSYVAMDVKNSLSSYGRTIGIPGFSTQKIEESMALIKASGIPYEFRTTVVKEYHTDEDLLDMASWLDGSMKWHLQEFRDAETCIKKGLSSISKEYLTNLLKDYIQKEFIRIY